jgi:hypothetical protein
MAAELRDFQRVGTLTPARAFRTTEILARYYAEIGAGEDCRRASGASRPMMGDSELLF